MFWKRLFIYAVPVALALLVAEVFRAVRDFETVRAEKEIVLGIVEGPDDLNPFREGDPLSERLKGYLFNHLLERNEAFELEPGLAISWNASSTARYFFVSDRHAEDALEKIVEAQDRWKEWGVVEVQAEKDEVRVGFKEPGGTGPREIHKLLDPAALLPVRRLHVKVLQSAWDSYLDYKRNGLESGQIRREWLESPTSYVLEVAGVTENFFREFKSYYDSNNTLGASYRFVEDIAYLYEPEILFSLREGVRWHDGELFTSEDVLFSYQFSKEQPWNARLREALAEVQAVTPVDENAVRVVYRGLHPLLLEEWSLIPMLPQHVLEGKDEEWWAGNFEQTPVGTGPFQTAPRDASGDLVFERHEGYFLGMPDTARIRFVSIAGRAERRIRLLRGEIDSYPVAGGEETFISTWDGRRFERVIAAPGRQVLLVWNRARSPFGEKRVRKALALAIDAQKLVAETCPARGSVSRGLFHPRSVVAEGEESVVPGHEIGAARELLASLGWVPGEDGFLRRPGQRLEVKLAIGGEAIFEAVAGSLKRDWSALGVEVKVVKSGGDLLPREIVAFPVADADAMLVSVPLPVDWLSFRYGAMGRCLDLSTVSSNGAGEAGVVNAVLEKFDEAISREERIELCGELERAVIEEQGLGCLFNLWEYRFLPTGEFALSRAIGDGHRMEKELEPVAAGIDFHLPWWIRKRGVGHE